MTNRTIRIWLILWAIALPVSIAGTSILYFPLLSLYILLGFWTFRIWPPTFGSVEKTFLVFWLLSFLSAALGVDPHHTHNIARLSKDLYFVSAVMLAAYLSREPEGSGLLRVFMITAVATAAVGVLQYAVGVNKINSSNGEFAHLPQWLAHAPPKLLKGLTLVNGRAIGTRAHPLTYAEGLLFPLGYCLSGLATRRRISWVWYVGFYLVLLGLIASQSRGPWIAAVVMIIFLCGLRPSAMFFRRLAWIALPGLLCFASPALRQRLRSITDTGYTSNAERLEMWHAGYHMLRDHPLLGVGPGNVHVASPQYQSEKTRADGPWGHLHNNYVTLAAERGLLGLLAFFVFIGTLITVLARGLKRERDHAESQLILLTALTSIVGWLVAGFTETVYHDSNVLMMFYFVMGIALATARGVLPTAGNRA